MKPLLSGLVQGLKSALTAAAKSAPKSNTLAVKPINQGSGTLAVGSSSTYKVKAGTNAIPKPTTNPQKTVSSTKVQSGGSKVPLQKTATAKSLNSKPKTPLKVEPVKTQRSYKVTVLDKNTNTIKTIDKVANLTAAEWEKVKAVEARKADIRSEFERQRQRFKSDAQYKSWLYEESQYNQKRVESQIEIEINSFTDRLKQLQQQFNDANDYDTAYSLWQEIETYKNYVTKTLDEYQQQYEAYGQVLQEEFDNATDLFNTRGFWDKITAPLAVVWDYSFGEKGILDPKRLINTTINTFNGSREVWQHGQRIEEGGTFTVNDAPYGDTGLLSLIPDNFKRAWNASQQQRYWKPDQLPEIDLSQFENDQDGLTDYITRINQERNRIRIIDFFAENALDPSWYIGAGQVKAGSRILKGTKTFKVASTKLDDFLNVYNSFVKSNSVTSKLDEAVRWLGKEYQPSWVRKSKEFKALRGKWDEYAKAVRTQFDDVFVEFTDNELITLQRLQDAGGDWSKIIKTSRALDKTSKSKIDDLYRFLKNTSDDLYGSEVMAGVAGKYRKAYRPIQREAIDQAAKANRVKQKFGKIRPSAFFRKARKNEINIVLDRSDLSYAWAKRVTQSEEIRRANKILRSIDKLDDRYQPSLWEKLTAPQRSVSNLWRKSVLGARPAWYVNNELYNQLAAVTSGGVDVFKNQKGWRQYLKSLPTEHADEVISGVGTDIGGGRLSRIASAQENRVRVALYKTWMDRGLSHKESIKQVNAWLFDYTVRNFERPIRSVIPFYKWQMNIGRSAVVMGFKTPRARKAFSEFYKVGYEQPLNALPNETITIKDPDTGEVIEYNPKEAMRGKLYNPFTGKWMNTPFNPFTPDGIANIGKNPILQASDELATNRDIWGNKLNAQSWWESFANVFPQFKLTQDFYKAYITGKTSFPEEFWLAEGSAFPKKSQGYDDSQSNYRKDLDPRVNVWKSLWSYLGVPSQTEFDFDRFKESKNYIDFNQEWFSTNWDKYEWEERLKKQNELASRYGYDLQKDIYDDKWSRYDTEFTQHQKELKKQASKFNSEFWAEYNSVEKGTSSRKIFVNEKRLEWETNQTFLENPYYNVLQQWFVDPKRPDASIAVDELSFWRTFYSTQDQKVRNKLFTKYPQFKKYPIGAAKQLGELIREVERLEYIPYRSTPKGAFWQEFFTFVDPVRRFQFYAQNWEPGFGGDDPERTLFWLRYFSSNPDIRKKMLRANPEYAKYDNSGRSSADWDLARESDWQEKQAKFADSREFGRIRTEREKSIRRSVRTRYTNKRINYKVR